MTLLLVKTSRVDRLCSHATSVAFHGLVARRSGSRQLETLVCRTRGFGMPSIVFRQPSSPRVSCRDHFPHPCDPAAL